jgi:anti-anti-sigma regulatory factor
MVQITTGGRNADTHAPGATTRPPNAGDAGLGPPMDGPPNGRAVASAVTVVIGQDRDARYLRQDILGAVAGQPRDLVIDLRQVLNRSNTGVAVLVGAQARQRSRLKSLTLVCGERSGTTQMALARSGMKGDFRTVTEIPPSW